MHSKAVLNKKNSDFGASSDFVGPPVYLEISRANSDHWVPQWRNRQVAWGCHVARIRQAAHKHAIIILVPTK